VGKELDLVKQFTNSMKKRLLELGYEDKDILALTENEKLKIIADSIAYKDNIIIRALKEEPPESIKGIEKPPEPIPSEGGTKVAVKEKVEVKPEIKKKAMTPEELEKLMKEKTEAKPEVKPEIKTTTIEKISPKVESRTNIDTFILPDVDVVPYYALVWENGQIVVKLITPEILRRGYVEVITKDGILTVGGEDLRTMSVDQIKKLLQTLEGNELKEAYKYYTVLYPSLAPAIKEQIGVREQEQIKAQESLQQQLKVQEQTKLQEQIKEQLKTQEQTQLQTGLQTQLQIQEQIKQQQKLKEEEALKTKVIIPPIVLTPKQQQQLEKIKTLLRPLSLTWRQGKVRWILPPREDGSYHNEDKFAVSSKTIVPGVTKYYEGEGSAYATLEFIGGKSQLPFKETDVDLGFSIIHLNEVNGELKMDVNPDESANWEGVNKYTKIKEEKEQELQYQEWRARYTGKPPEDVSMPIPVRVKPFKETPLEMHKVEWIPYSKWNDSPVKVYKVDGKYVRENIDPDFTQGGHWLVYNYVPKNEVWIERMRNPEEDKLSLGHELDEINDMDKNDETYEDAHQAAIEREFGRVRRNPQSVDAEIENALSKFVHYETNEKKPEKIPEMKVQERIQRSRKKTIIDTSKRYYLGHETRQPELVANL
jgi:hypothetical protein